jgi:hypothetical protein
VLRGDESLARPGPDPVASAARVFLARWRHAVATFQAVLAPTRGHGYTPTEPRGSAMRASMMMISPFLTPRSSHPTTISLHHRPSAPARRLVAVFPHRLLRSRRRARRHWPSFIRFDVFVPLFWVRVVPLASRSFGFATLGRPLTPAGLLPGSHCFLHPPRRFKYTLERPGRTRFATHTISLAAA